MEEEDPDNPDKKPKNNETNAEKTNTEEEAGNAEEENKNRSGITVATKPSGKTSSRKISNTTENSKLSNKKLPEFLDDQKEKNGEVPAKYTSSIKTPFIPSGTNNNIRNTSVQNATIQNNAIQGATGPFAYASGLLQKRSPFIHNPPQPEERRARVASPRSARDYIVNLREDLADFQESHGLPRTRDYSFISLGLALAQETGRAIYSVFLMLLELFPIIAIVSLILRFALDKIIEILETPETAPKVKKSVIFALEMLAIMIPLWILIGTIIIPLMSLILSIFKKMLQFKGKRKCVKPKPKQKVDGCGL